MEQGDSMKIIEPYYEILTPINGKEALQTIEYCARTCYQSYDKQTDDSCFQFVKMLMGRNHESCLEHYSFSVKFVVDRAIQNEIVRHRLSSFCCSSTRYCNYSKDKFGNEITVIRPFFYKDGTAEFEFWKKAMKDAEAYYLFLVSHSKPEEARCVLPLSLKTELVMTANIREWRHFLKLRTSAFSHPQMRQVTIPLLNELKSLIPVVFDDIECEGE
jgi:thymidylate synthase (FAD)